jgi:hypothetical protein
VLGLYRAWRGGESPAPAIALALLIGAIGAVWFVRRASLPGGFLARPFALLLATVGALSAYSGFAAPFISFYSRFSTPLFSLTAAALLVFADAGDRVQIATAICFVAAVAMLQVALW